MVSRNKARLLPLVACMVYSLPALAGSNQAGPESLLELPLEKLLSLEVSTASKFKQAPIDAPGSVTVLTAEDIKVFGWRTLAEALNSVPGLYITNDQNYSYLGARGFARPGDYNTRFLLLIDGVRSNDAIYDQATIGRDFLIDMDLVERIEYASGSSSSIYGSNAFFGVINVITKGGQQIRGPQASVEIGSAGERKGRASYGLTTENGAQFLLSATAFHRKGEDQYYPEFDSPGTNFGVAQGLDHERTGSVFVKASFGPFAAFIAHNERERGIPTASYEQAFNDSRSQTTDAYTLAALSYHDRLNDTTQWQARISWGQQEFRGVYAYSDPDYRSLDNSDSSWIGTEISLLSTAWHSHKLLAGLDYQRAYKIRQFDVNEYPARSPDTPVFSDGVQRDWIQDDNRDNNRAGLFLQDEITLRQDLLANIGVRYDYNSEVSNAVSPRLALIYKWTPDTTFKTIYGRAFRAPNAFEMYYSTPGEGGQKGNTDLKPERIRSLEFSVQQALSRHSSLLATVYENKVTDLITQITDPDDGLRQNRNISSATAKGMELQYELATDGGIRLRASQSWQRAKDNDTDRQLTNSPRSLTKLNLSLPVWGGKAISGLEARHIGRRLTTEGAVGGTWLANATLFSARLINNAELSLSIYNLFDRQYADPAAEEHVQDVLAQEGRAFRSKLTYNF